MRIHISIKISTCIIAILLFFSCNQSDSSKKNPVIIEQKSSHIASPSNGQRFKQGDLIHFTLSVDSTKQLDSIKCTINNNSSIVSTNPSFDVDTKDAKLGKWQVSIEVFFKNQNKDFHSMVLYVLADTRPDDYKYKIIKTYPHDPTSYTQGLTYYQGALYEGTGLYKKSKLRKLNYKTNTVLQEINLADNIFGEGVTIVNNKIIQLTWKESIGFIYNLSDFSLIRNFNMPSGEGWGLTNDGKTIYSSDGSSSIFLLDTATLLKKGEIQVADNTDLIDNINEMEYVNGIIYANIYQTNLIAMIHPATGKVIGKIDCSGLLKEEDKHVDIDVLNGIAYLPESNHFLITGKNWPKMFEVVWVKK